MTEAVLFFWVLVVVFSLWAHFRQRANVKMLLRQMLEAEQERTNRLSAIIAERKKET